MESSPQQIITYHTTVERVGNDSAFGGWQFKLKEISTIFHLQGEPALSPRDRVKITITKEPADALPS